MKRILIVLTVLVLSTAPAWADFQAGLTAYSKGDYAAALREWRPLAEQGDASAQSNLGVMYANGQGVTQDYGEAVKWYRKAVVQGDADAQYNLGVSYDKGQGVAQDDAEAVKWYRKAADQGVALAQYYLGNMYAGGQGVAQNYGEAARWYRKAARQGVAEAQFNLGSMYNKGQGVAQDYGEAIKWYRKAADQGAARAQYTLGLRYNSGRGVPQNYGEAAKWYRKAADQGVAEAQFNLGVMYAQGQGVLQNYAQAVKWYRKAADQGYDKAQFNLGVMYAQGQGVPQNYAQAYAWFSLAAAQGHANAVKARDMFAKLMTPAQIAEGQKMARDWRPAERVAAAPQATVPSVAATPAVAPSIAGPFPTKPVAVHFAKSRSRADDIAVIIGNANYREGKDIPNVTPAYADAAGIKHYIKQSLGIREENIIFLKDASQSELIATFGSATNPKGQLFKYVKPGKSRVFVYYSGHGAPGGEEGNSYLVPSNAQASLIDLNGYPLKTLYKNLGQIPAKSVTVVLEACFSGASQSGSLVSKASPIYLKAKETNIPANITVISAGAANQIASWEQDSSSGLFTKYFLKGMSGEADAKPYGNGDGKVGYDELGRYFKDTLTYYARRYYGREQTPQIVVRTRN